jgi:hypothetical protein
MEASLVIAILYGRLPSTHAQNGLQRVGGHQAGDENAFAARVAQNSTERS